MAMMQFVGKLLIFLGDCALALWEFTRSGLAWIGNLLDAVLNPILSPLFGWVNPVCVRIGDACFAAIAPLPTWLGITLVSAILGVVMLFAFRHLSNQTAIARAKDDIKASLLAMKLFRDDLRVVFLSQLRLLAATVRLQRYVLAPVLWSLLPMLFILAQMGLRYQWRPLHVGERAILKLRAAPDASGLEGLTLAPHEGVEVEVGPVPGGGEWVWRIRALTAGRHTLRILTTVPDPVEISKEIVVGDSLTRVSAMRPGSHWLDRLFHPVEAPFAKNSVVRNIEIMYPSVQSYVSGADYWVVFFFIVSMITALVLAPVFRVKF